MILRVSEKNLSIKKTSASITLAKKLYILFVTFHVIQSIFNTLDNNFIK